MKGLFRSLVLAETHLVKLSWEPNTGTVAALAHKPRMTLEGSFFLSLRMPFRFLLTKALFTKLPHKTKRMRYLGERKVERKRTQEK